MGLGFYVPDMTGYRQREDGNYRTDQAEEAHQKYLQDIRDRHAKASACAQRVRGDELLKELDRALDHGGLRDWIERYIVIDCIEKLIERSKEENGNDPRGED